MGNKHNSEIIEENINNFNLSDERKLQLIDHLNQTLFSSGKNQIEIDPIHKLGNADSAHNVIFAKTTDESEDKLELVVKPYEKHQKGENESKMIDFARKLGFITLEKYSNDLIEFQDLKILITKRMPQLSSMNQINWAKFYPCDPGFGQIVNTLKDIISFTRQMHEKNFSHGDYQVKNITRNILNQFVLIDLECASNNNDDFKSRKKDIEKLGKSLVRKRFLKDCTQEIFDDFFINIVIFPYLEKNCESSQFWNMADEVIKNIKEYRERIFYIK